VTSIVGLWTFPDSSRVPIGALGAMSRKYHANRLLSAVSGAELGLDCCRKILEHSRPIGRLVAFIRMLSELIFFSRAMPFVRDIKGFEPCEPFAARDNQGRGGIGFAGESTCLSALIDAFNRSHEVAYLFDASASSARDEMSADEVQHADSKTLGIYGDVHETADSIASTLPRKLGHGKNAGG
jgi:hypothetical protein